MLGTGLGFLLGLCLCDGRGQQTGERQLAFDSGLERFGRHESDNRTAKTMCPLRHEPDQIGTSRRKGVTRESSSRTLSPPSPSLLSFLLSFGSSPDLLAALPFFLPSLAVPPAGYPTTCLGIKIHLEDSKKGPTSPRGSKSFRSRLGSALKSVDYPYCFSPTEGFAGACYLLPTIIYPSQPQDLGLPRRPWEIILRSFPYIAGHFKKKD
ncbi:hypothetical protein VTN49DRAFT_5123 [Thermomyces lanuginosus]|uniref:uncharacterized protein n=1 Tax=Thermomyces lanuginosus TaxID=5541 RepID=UPI0037431E3C